MDLRDQIEHIRRGAYEFKVALAEQERVALQEAADRYGVSQAEVIRAALRLACVLPQRGGQQGPLDRGQPRSTLGDTARRAGGLGPVTGPLVIDPTEVPERDIDRSGEDVEA